VPADPREAVAERVAPLPVDVADLLDVVLRAVQRGIMLFAPVGVGGCAVKVNPPLVIGEEALREGMEVLEEVARGL
jgi:4-aminobutyrate aminotransferase-like enzyme